MLHEVHILRLCLSVFLQLQLQRQQLDILEAAADTLKKVHFWTKFWSIWALVSFAIGAIISLAIALS